MPGEISRAEATHVLAYAGISQVLCREKGRRTGAENRSLRSCVYLTSCGYHAPERRQLLSWCVAREGRGHEKTTPAVVA